MPATHLRHKSPGFRCSVLIAGGLAAVLATAVVVAAGSTPAGATPAAPGAETLGAAVTAPWLDDTDSTPAIIAEGGEYYAIVSDGSNVWHRWAGTSLDAMTEQGIANYASLTAHDEGTPNDGIPDDKDWMTDIWADPQTGTWYGFVHVEYDYTYTSAGAAIGHTRRVVLASSTDKGATWTWVGDILTPGPVPAGAPSGAVDFGDGDQRLVVDSSNQYLYLYYTTGYYLPSQTMATGNPVTWISVARCPMADITSPGCWTKWSGSFSPGTPGVGGADVAAAASPLPSGLTGASSLPAFTYDSATGEFTAIGNGAISVADDLATQDWAAPAAVTGTLATATCWYLWTVDPDTGSRYSAGQTVDLYGGGGGCGSVTRYQPVTLGSAPVQEASGDPWLYQYATSNSGTVPFTPMSWASSRDLWQGDGTYCTVYGGDQQEPGSPGGCDAARTWQAPAAMTVALGASGPVTVSACQASCGSGVELQVFRNGTQIWPAAGQPAVIVPNGGSYTFPPLADITVNAGDEIEFLTSAVGTDNYYDNTTWDQTVTEQQPVTDTYAPAPWRYQYTTDATASPATFATMSYDPAIDAWTAPSSYPYCEVSDSDLQSPGPPGTCAAARTWQAPSSGTVSIAAASAITVAGGTPACGGNTAGVSLRILKNGTQIWPASGAVTVANAGSYSFPALPGVAVTAGDDIEFVTSANPTVSYCDNVTWDPVVTENGTSWQASDSFVQARPFRYEYALGSSLSFQPMAYTASTAIWNGPAGYSDCDIYGASWQEPAVGCAASRAWQAPYSSTVTLPASTAGLAACPASAASTCSPGVDITVDVVTAAGVARQLTSTIAVGHGDSATVPAVTVPVNAGDQIEFVSSALGSNNYYDNVTWSPQITDPGPAATEEPPVPAGFTSATTWYASAVFNQPAS